MIDNIDGDLTKVCFCELCINAKIMQNLNSKPMLKVTTKIVRVYIDLWGFFPDIFLKKNCYICTATNQATGQVWTDFWLNKRELLQFI